MFGGGLYAYNSDVTCINNTISSNTAGVRGGGVYCERGCDVKISNTILWGNLSSLGSEIAIGWPGLDADELSIEYSDVKGRKTGIFVEKGGRLHWGAGMINQDPRFANSDNYDYHIAYDSPCRDAGNKEALKIRTDFEGDLRGEYGKVDIGADEFYTHLYTDCFDTSDGFLNIKYIDLPRSTPIYLWVSRDSLDIPFTSKWGNWFLQSPVSGPYDHGMIPANGIRVVPLRIPPNCTGMYYLQAMIGNKLTNSCSVAIE